MPVEGTRLHLHYHTEKTAGTSVQEKLREIYGPESVYLYYPQERVLRCMKDTVHGRADGGMFELYKQLQKQYPLLASYIYKLRVLFRDKFEVADNGNNTFVPSYCKAVTGHMSPVDIESKCDGRSLFRSVIIREPLERTWSHWLHIQRTKNQGSFSVEVPVGDLKDFETFALSLQMTNFQTNRLKGLGIDDLNVVGVFDQIDIFGRDLVHSLDLKGKISETLPHSNQARYYPKMSVSSEFMDLFKQKNELDYNFYETAKNHI